ncbi:MAG: Maf family protein [Betaproteobacteria bacterium]
MSAARGEHPPAYVAPRSIYLASRSPRRKELLRQIGVDFDELVLRDGDVGSGEIVERPRVGEAALDYVTRIARTKAAIGWHDMTRMALPPRPVLAADTEVIVDDGALGKPGDAASAAAMLTRLSATTHRVTTVVAVRWNARMHVAVSNSYVMLRALGDDEIARYVQSGEAFDKAGGYAIQGKAAAFIAHLSGSYTGVMGLPLYETARLLNEIGYRAGAEPPARR